jgi:hypothetical protein
MQVIVHEKLVGAVCSVPCRMAFPPQELLCSRILIAQVQYRV